MKSDEVITMYFHDSQRERVCSAMTLQVYIHMISSWSLGRITYILTFFAVFLNPCWQTPMYLT